MLYLRDQVTVTPTNLSPVISICSIVCLLVSTLSVAGRIFTKVAVVRRLDMDDYTMICAAAFSIGETVAVLSASAHGLGKRWEGLDQTHKDSLEKALYSSALLFILSIVFVKISITSFLRGLAPIKALKRTGEALGAVFLTWGLASFLATAFQCNVPNVWRRRANSCVDIRGLRVSFDVINILTELALIVWPAAIISRIHASKKRRAVLISVFAFRLLVVGACVAQIIYTYRATQDGGISLDQWSAMVCVQVVQCTSLTTACIPYLQPFLKSLESGYLWGEEFRCQSTKDFSYTPRKPSHSASNSNPLTITASESRAGPAQSESLVPGAQDLRARPPGIAMLPLPTSEEPFRTQMGIAWDNRSASSQVGLTESAAAVPVAVDTRRCELEGY